MSKADIDAANKALLAKICGTHGAKGYGSISAFWETSPMWCCPCCYRSKPEIARLDRNGYLLCSIVWHHDHACDHIPNELQVRMSKAGEWQRYLTMIEHAGRFSDILICADCNVADSAAKAIVGATEAFSFAPFEIRHFVMARPNVPHQINPDRARIAYNAAQASMAVLGQQMDEVRAALTYPDAAWEQVCAPALRVLKALKT